MKLPQTQETPCEESAPSSHSKASQRLTDLLSSKSDLDKATKIELAGFVCRIDGRTYILNKDELVFDSKSREVVYDPKIYNKVFDRYQETLAAANVIRRKATHLVHGDSAKEGGVRLQLVFGSSKDLRQLEKSGKSEAQAV